VLFNRGVHNLLYQLVVLGVFLKSVSDFSDIEVYGALEWLKSNQINNKSPEKLTSWH